MCGILSQVGECVVSNVEAEVQAYLMVGLFLADGHPIEARPSGSRGGESKRSRAHR